MPFAAIHGICTNDIEPLTMTHYRLPNQMWMTMYGEQNAYTGSEQLQQVDNSINRVDPKVSAD